MADYDLSQIELLANGPVNNSMKVRPISEEEKKERRKLLGIDENENTGIESYEITQNDTVIAHFHIDENNDSTFWFTDNALDLSDDTLNDAIAMYRNSVVNHQLNIKSFVHTKDGKKVPSLPNKIMNNFKMVHNEKMFHIPVTNKEFESLVALKLIDEQHRILERAYIAWSKKKDKELEEKRKQARKETDEVNLHEPKDY